MLSRRNFLKIAALATPLGGLIAAATRRASPAEKMLRDFQEGERISARAEAAFFLKNNGKTDVYFSQDGQPSFKLKPGELAYLRDMEVVASSQPQGSIEYLEA
jgi:hypothetical protein